MHTRDYTETNMRLTDLSIRALKAPEKGVIVYSDDTLTGFGVRVSQAGTKSYVLTHGVRRHRETIGRVGIISLSAARTAAKEMLAEYTLGKHRPQPKSWTTALDEFLKEKEVKRKNTHTAYKRHLVYFPFGETKLDDITPHELQKDLDRIKKIGERTKTFVVLRVFINWCHQKSYVDRNPMERMKPPSQYKPRERVLTPEELKQVWRACGDDTFGKIVKLLMLTGQRRDEISKLQRDMIGECTIILPPTLTKNGREHTFPIGPFSASVLKSTKRTSQDTSPTRSLFPARGGSGKSFNGWSKSKAALDKRCGVTDWTLHDLRRSLRTYWAEMGVSDEVAETYINHISGARGGLKKVYNHARYWEPMKHAVEQWERFLIDLTAEA